MKTIEPLNSSDFTPPTSDESPHKEPPSTISVQPDPIDFPQRQPPQAQPTYMPPAPRRLKRRLNIPSLLLNIFAGLLLFSGVYGLIFISGDTLLFVLTLLQCLVAIGLFLRWTAARYLTIILVGLNLVLSLVTLSALLAFNPGLLPSWVLKVGVYVSILILLSLPSIKQQF